MDFNKTALSIDDQIKRLKERGMIIPNEAKAKMYLSNISYYRLSAYWFTLLENPKTDHLFSEKTSFETVLDTYVFDRKLRLLIFDEFGSPTEIINEFGSKDNYLQAVKELEIELYKTA